ncbi:MAG: CRISPR-associated helicase Cas3' [Armatimonadota bacterium]|nr:CRISPR-associated helicase Cas3' [Armatimonadota bacterium]
MRTGLDSEFYEVFSRALGSPPFAYQRTLACAGELPQLVRVPTGAGKTAAAVLAWLYRRRFHPDEQVREATPRRLVYCLPMRVLVEQTLEAVRAWLTNLDLEAEVGVHQLMGGALDEDWVRRPERDAVLVGTMDMLLSRALNRGYAAARSRWPLEFGLLNNDCLWVLDEVQLMGNGLATSAQLAAFRRSFGTARPCPSLWMSATVDESWLATVDHPAPACALTLTGADRSGPLSSRLRAAKTLRKLSVAGWPEGGAEAILDRHKPGTLTLVVVNTVERARRLHAELRKRAAGREIEVRLLHSRFRPPDRRAALEAALAPTSGAGRIVVATQVVEAGVDVSAATLVTELAPWTSLVQRFGRCNRFGDHAAGEVWWVDLADREAPPYAPEELSEARARLAALEGSSVSPEALEGLGPGRPPAVRYVVRRPDLLDLFDTEPDLAGNDVDVSRFIRDDADVDVQVFWRQWEGEAPAPDLPGAAPDELCPVPVWEVREFLFPRGRRAEGSAGYVWDHLDRQWRRLVSQEDLRPGLVVLLPAEAGGYRPETGWDGERTDPVEPLVAAAPPGPEEGMDDEPPEEVAGAWVALSDHLVHAERQLQELVATVVPGVEPWVRKALEAAARWHDVGKAHEVFQRALLAPLSDEERAACAQTLWAKSAVGRRLDFERRHFRHELASALALLAAPSQVHGLEGDELDLAAYLVAAHHGKVRMALRSLRGERRPPEPGLRFARGVWDGDRLGPLQLDGVTVPALTLDLSVMEAGRGADGRPSWSERVLRLRDRVGPFVLAYLEALLRVADWEASAAEGSSGGGGRGA